MRGADGAAQLVSIARFLGTPIDHPVLAELLGCTPGDLAALAAGHPARINRLHLATLAAFADETIAFRYELDFADWDAERAAAMRAWLDGGQVTIADRGCPALPMLPRTALADLDTARAALRSLRDAA